MCNSSKVLIEKFSTLGVSSFISPESTKSGLTRKVVLLGFQICKGMFSKNLSDLASKYSLEEYGEKFFLNPVLFIFFCLASKKDLCIR